jgi:hypothetical protein
VLSKWLPISEYQTAKPDILADEAARIAAKVHTDTVRTTDCVACDAHGAELLLCIAQPCTLQTVVAHMTSSFVCNAGMLHQTHT